MAPTTQLENVTRTPPKGWQQKRDAQGAIFFCNVETGEVSCTAPKEHGFKDNMRVMRRRFLLTRSKLDALLKAEISDEQQQQFHDVSVQRQQLLRLKTATEVHILHLEQMCTSGKNLSDACKSQLVQSAPPQGVLQLTCNLEGAHTSPELEHGAIAEDYHDIWARTKEEEFIEIKSKLTDSVLKPIASQLALHDKFDLKKQEMEYGLVNLDHYRRKVAKLEGASTIETEKLERNNSKLSDVKYEFSLINTTLMHDASCLLHQREAWPALVMLNSIGAQAELFHFVNRGLENFEQPLVEEKIAQLKAQMADLPPKPRLPKKQDDASNQRRWSAVRNAVMLANSTTESDGSDTTMSDSSTPPSTPPSQVEVSRSPVPAM